MLTPEELNWLEIAARAAYGAELETKCPAEITLAQAALESGWGAHQPGNNCFGIKAKPWQKCQMLPTKEVINGKEITELQGFAVYDTLQEAFEAHGIILTRGISYQLAFERYEQDHDLDSFIVRVAVRYATAPGYASRIIEILAMPEVTFALAKARQAAS